MPGLTYAFLALPEAEPLIDPLAFDCAFGATIRGVLHEIRNPLQSLAYLRELEGDIPARFLGVLRDAADRTVIQSELLASLFDRPVVRDEPAAVQDVLRTAQALQAAVTHPDARIRVETSPDLPAVQVPAPTLLRSVMMLINNAREAVSTVGAGEVRIETDTDGPTRVIVRVCDDGGGVADDQREHLFVPGWTTKPPPHRGLGLCLARLLLECHGGSVECVDSANACFRAVVPVSTR